MGGIPGIGKKLRELVQLAPRMGKPIRSELALVTPAQGEKRHRVAFFLGCMMNVAMPDTSRATVRLLTAPAAKSSRRAARRAAALRKTTRRCAAFRAILLAATLRCLKRCLDDVEAIVTDCAGCSGALREYAEWLHDDPQWAARAKQFSGKVRDVTE